jgi:hypothetical protein
MEFNCEQVVERYLLNQNPLYAFSFPIAILVAIIMFGVAKAYTWSDNSYVNQLLIPILALLLTMVIIDIISRLMISNNERTKLLQLCKLWMHDPSIKNNPILSKMIDMDLVSSYNGNLKENFTIQDNNIDNLSKNNEEDFQKVFQRILSEQENVHVENVKFPLSEIKNVHPYPIDFNNVVESSVEGVTNRCSIISEPGVNLSGRVAPIPGPQWLPQSAESVQNRLKNNQYTAEKCSM